MLLNQVRLLAVLVLLVVSVVCGSLLVSRASATDNRAVAGITFPKHFAAATLDHGGTTHYFISEETRREFAKRHGLAP